MPSLSNNDTIKHVADQANSALKSVAGDRADSVQQQLKQGAIGELAAQFPSDLFVWATLGSIALSASMKISGRSSNANFVGEWAPTFLALGIYTKLTNIEKRLFGSSDAG